jgi:hypothetical protein
VGICHVIFVTDLTECVEKESKDGDVDIICIGNLQWDTTKSFVDFSEFAAELPVNAEWRKQFVLVPDIFMETWAPLFFGLALVLMHGPSNLRLNLLCGSWGRVSFWMTFNAIFCNFGYGTLVEGIV